MAPLEGQIIGPEDRSTNGPAGWAAIAAEMHSPLEPLGRGP